MLDIKINDNCLLEVERRLNVYLNSNKLELLENQHAVKLVKDGYVQHNKTSLYLNNWCNNQRLKENSPLSQAELLQLPFSDEPDYVKSCLSPVKGIPKVHFHFDLSTPVVKGDLIPDHLRLSALEIIDGIPSDPIKIHTDGSRLSDRAVSGIYIEKREERSLCHRNPNFSSVFKSELIAKERGLETVLNEQDFGDLWILSDSCSSLQHLYNWITIGDKAGVSILQKLTQISESHDVRFQWISSHVNII
ncbi:metabotropic glutamate receptor 8 [Trichonephila clavipes]|nr:metabotropic glutamate receptor 8 [Trichonephila clavipes]